MKQIVVIVAGTGQHHDLSVEPGTAARDILRQVNLPDYVLSKDNGNFVFGADENIYPKIADGEKLAATARTDVGSPGHLTSGVPYGYTA